MNTKIIVIIVVAIVVLVAGYFLVKGMGTGAPSQQMNVPTDSQADANEQVVPVVDVQVESDAANVTSSYEVAYTNAGFSPSALTIKTGDTVIFKNQSSGNMWVGSAMHPTHMVYSGTNLQSHCPDAEGDDFDACENDAPGNSWAFTFKKAGSWGYHNHSGVTHFGKITVE